MTALATDVEISFSPLLHRYTLEEFWELPDPEDLSHYELIGMMYVSDNLKNRMGKKRTSADIVFEYVSRSNATYDRTTKADTYLALGVGELWLIDPFTVTIEVRYSTEYKGKPIWESRSYFKGEVAESRVLAGWRVSVDELFAGLI